MKEDIGNLDSKAYKKRVLCLSSIGDRGLGAATQDRGVFHYIYQALP